MTENEPGSFPEEYWISKRHQLLMLIVPTEAAVTVERKYDLDTTYNALCPPGKKRRLAFSKFDVWQIRSMDFARTVALGFAGLRISSGELSGFPLASAAAAYIILGLLETKFLVTNKLKSSPPLSSRGPNP